MKAVSLALIFLCFTALYAMGGDSFASAFPITYLPYSDYGNTSASSNSTGNNSRDTVYKIRSSVQLTSFMISLAGSSFDTVLWIYAADQSTVLWYNDDYGGNYYSVLDYITLQPNIDYYIVIEGYGTYYYGDYNIFVDSDYNGSLLNNIGPSPISNIYPENNATNVSAAGTTITWNFGANTDTYDLYFSASSPPLNQVVYNAPSGVSGSYYTGQLAYNTIYYWRIVSRNSSLMELVSPIYSFKTGPNPAARMWRIDLLDSDGDGWNGAWLNLWVNSDAVFNMITLSTGYGPSSHEFYVLDGDEIFTHYSAGLFPYENEYIIYNHRNEVEVTSGSGGTTPTGITLTVVLNPVLTPPASTVVSPLNASVDQAFSGYLQWTHTSNTQGYRLFLGTDYPPTNIANNWDYGYTNSAWYGGLTGGQTYYWMIVPYNAHGGALNCPIWSFNIYSHPPAAATNPSPANQQSNLPLAINLSWSLSDFTNGIYFCLGTDNPPTNMFNMEDYGYDTSMSIDSFAPLTTYYWKIVPYNPNGSATNSVVWSFTTQGPAGVTTSNMSNIGSVSATGNANIISLGAPNPNQHGHCWNTTGMPTTANQKTTLGAVSSIGAFTSSIEGLSPNSTYYVRAYATNAVTTVYGDQIAFSTLPIVATNPLPANGGTCQSLPVQLDWTAPLGGCSGYEVYFGTDNPPTNIISATLTTENTFSLSNLAYNTSYYWKIVPYNASGIAEGNAVWSFTTPTIYTQEVPPVIPDFPDATPIYPVIIIPEISGVFAPIITSGWNPPDTPFINAGLHINISGVNLGGMLIEIDPDLSFVPSGIVYRIQASGTWIFVPAEVDWRNDYIYFTVMEAKADGDLDILFPQSEDDTLPVELSSFTAIYKVENFINLNWVAESETEHAGYNILRSETPQINQALQINETIINSGVQIGTQVSYYFIDDDDLFPNHSYYYWLESVSTFGMITYHGPIMVNTTIDSDNTEPLPSLITELYNAFPNPFNPSTVLRYGLANPTTVNIEIFNARGQMVKRYRREHLSSGIYSLVWDGTDQNRMPLGSGLYLVRMKADNYISTKRITLIK